MHLSPSAPSLSIASFDELPELVLSSLDDWKVITMIGDDKKHYLHGQVTCDVVSLEKDQATYGAHCDAKGKMNAIFRLFHTSEGYALFQHGSGIDHALTEIKKYAVFSKVDIQISDAALIGVMGAQSQTLIEQVTGKSINLDSNNQVITFEQGTAVQMDAQRWLIMSNNDFANTLFESHSSAICDQAIWDCADILSGIPRVTASQQLEHIPQAMNLQALEGISFTKGCYTGQETVARAKYRGINKRAMYLLEGQDCHSLPESFALERRVGDNWRSAGELVAQYHFNNGQLIGLAVLPNNLEDDTEFRLTALPEVQLKHIAPPYSLD